MDAEPEQVEAAEPAVAQEERTEDTVEQTEAAPEQKVESEATQAEAEQEELFIAEAISEPVAEADNTTALKAVIEAAIYITDEPLSAEQIATALEQPLDRVKEVLTRLVEEYAAPDRGLSVRELAGGYKMATKAEYHEAIRKFVKRLQPPLKLSLAALETLAVIAYKQPITAPEVLEVRGVQGAGVLKTLLDRKLIAGAGRKNVLGKPMMYKTTREFLVQFGLSSLAELPTLKEFEELGRLSLSDEDEHTPAAEESAPAAKSAGVSEPEEAEPSPEPIAEAAPEAEAQVQAEHHDG